MNPEPGTIICVRVDGVEYDTVIDLRGNQRFVENPALRARFESGADDDKKWERDYRDSKISKKRFLQYYIDIGFTVNGIMAIDHFRDLIIENPAVRTKES